MKEQWDKLEKVIGELVMDYSSLAIEEKEYLMQRALFIMNEMKDNYIGGKTMNIDITDTIPVLPWEESPMLYSHRVWFAGQEPIGFNGIKVLSGLMNAYGRDSIIYIESMTMKPFLDKCIKALQAGITLWDGTCPILYREGKYYRENGIELNELLVRGALQSYYRKNEDMYDIDKSYIEGKIIQSS